MTRWRNWKCSCARRSSNPPTNWWVGYFNRPSTVAMRLTKLSLGKCAKVGKASKPRESLAASLWREITTITPAKTKVIIPRTTLWVWKSATHPPWPSSSAWKAPTNKLTSKRSVTFSKPVASWSQRGKSSGWSSVLVVLPKLGRSAQLSRGENSDAPIMYVSADGAQVCPMVRAELEGRRGKQPERQSQNPPGLSGLRLYPTPHPTRKAIRFATGNPLTYVSSFSNPALSLVPACVRKRPSDAAWAALAR